MIKEQKLLKRNLHLLLNYSNIQPENYISRFNITNNLQDVYHFFDGETLPNKTNLNRISRLLAIPIAKLEKVHNLVPVIIKHHIKYWHMSFKTFANGTQPDKIKTQAQNKARLKAVYHHSVLKDAGYTRQQYKYIADVLGVSNQNAHKLASFYFYEHPSNVPNRQYPRLRQMLFLHLRNVKRDIKDVSWDLDSNHPREDFYDMASLHYALKELFQMCRIVSDMQSAIKVRHCIDFFKRMIVFRPNSSYAEKAHLNNYLCLIKIDKVIKRITAKYSSEREYNYAKSQKFSLIAGIHANGFDQDARIQYIIYGIHSNKHDLSTGSLKTYVLTTPGLAALDPGWRELTYKDGMGDYFHTLFPSFHVMNNYVKKCTLSRDEVRYVINLLHQQGLSYPKILPCNQIDWWLNCHNVEYREKGDEEA